MIIDMRNKHFFMIHGWGGFPKEGWRPWLAEQLRNDGHKVTVLSMPNTQHPKLSEWLEHLQQSIGMPDEDCILIGHSLGCITILRYLENLKKEEQIGGAIFVSSFYEDLGKGYEEIYEFVEQPVDWKSVHKHCRYFSVIHSDDDSVVPLSFAERLASQLNTSVYLTTGKNHFSGDDGVKETPEIIDEIQRILGFGKTKTNVQ